MVVLNLKHHRVATSEYQIIKTSQYLERVVGIFLNHSGDKELKINVGQNRLR
jgi:hypothetical protein